MSFPSASTRTKTWDSEILLSVDLHAQLDILHDYINALLDGIDGHAHTGIDGDGKKIALTAGVSGTLPATNGGTGSASYAVGDVLVADTTTSLAKLSSDTKGKALTSGGAGVAPTYEGMTTGGDIEYHDGTNRQRLAKGTAGQILQSNGTTPGWVSFFGTPVSKNEDIVYTADTDGFLNGYVTLEQNDQFTIYNDSNVLPTTVVAQISTNANIGSTRVPFNVPIKRGTYYKFSVITGATSPSLLQFTPIGA